MRHILIAMTLLATPSIAKADWYSHGYYRPMFQPYYRQPVYQNWTTVGNTRFYSDSWGNSGSSTYIGNTRFDSFNYRAPVPVTPFWGW